MDDTSTSFCYADNPYITAKLIPIDYLKAAIQYGMENNLFIHFVYPDHVLPNEYQYIIDSIRSSKIVPAKKKEFGNIVVYDGWNIFLNETIDRKTTILRTKMSDLLVNYEKLTEAISSVVRLNVTITDVDKVTDETFEKYKEVLIDLQNNISEIYNADNPIQLNLVSDRVVLDSPNHCNAGVESITVAPSGDFYICPAFYYYNSHDTVGNIYSGLKILNSQLYALDHAPLCRECDAYQCKRCVWLNQKTTGEVNIPSHEQCVVSHLERFASSELLSRFKEKGLFSNSPDIPVLDYTDPFYKNKHN